MNLLAAVHQTRAQSLRTHPEPGGGAQPSWNSASGFQGLQGFSHLPSFRCVASLSPRMLPVGSPGHQIQKWGWNPEVLGRGEWVLAARHRPLRAGCLSLG